MKDDAVQAGYFWLVNHIIRHWPELSERVDRESGEQMHQEKEVMRQRYERFRSQGLAPPGAVMDDEPDLMQDPFKPIQDLVLTNELKDAAPQQNGDSKIPLRSSKGRSGTKLKPESIPRSDTSAVVPVKRDIKIRSKGDPGDLRKKMPVRKSVLGNGNKVAPIA